MCVKPMKILFKIYKVCDPGVDKVSQLENSYLSIYNIKSTNSTFGYLPKKMQKYFHIDLFKMKSRQI